MTKRQRAETKKEDKGPVGKCKKMDTKHYRDRDSPPYSGTACCNKKRIGNDGQEYISKPASDGSCRWHLMKTRSQTKKSSCE